ncbi:MAG: hypothetical protein J1F60_07995 [Oscillospiraceae bacterium]|nr:hypothetical protein [Oscillospiraceae bacterium]
MFKPFCDFVKIADNAEAKDMDSFLEVYGGKTFLNGLYRVYSPTDAEKWTDTVGKAFPPYFGKIRVFGFDWLGRHFAINKATGTVLLFEPGTGDVFDIPADFVDFHNVEIAEHHTDSLASEFFHDWYEANDHFVLPHNKCAGYKVPLFLNGDDEIYNLEVSDMEVYWELMSQLM